MQHFLQVSSESAFVAACEMVCYECIKTRATRADEQFAVRQAVIHGDGFAMIDHLNRFLRSDGDVQMSCKAVTATHRDDAEGGVGAFEPFRYFVHRAVTSDSDYCVKAHSCVLVGEFRGMSGVLCTDDVRQPLVGVQGLHDQLRQFFLRVLRLFVARNRIDDKCYIFHKYIIMQSKSAAKVQKINDIHKSVCHFFTFYAFFEVVNLHIPIFCCTFAP